jgi:hypothetical protein
VVRYRCPPHEYYICNVSQRPTQQKSTSKGGGLSEVPSLIHNGVLMYMRTVTEPRGTLPSVCAPAGLRRPCAHTSDSRIPIRHHLSNPQKSSIPLQTTPRRCIGTIDTGTNLGYQESSTVARSSHGNALGEIQARHHTKIAFAQ